MSAYEFDGFSEGDWDSHEELAWNEFDWQQYLKSNEREIAEFLAHYHRLKHRPYHLDEIARILGWDMQDWSLGDLDDDDEEDEGTMREDDGGLDPYTIHKHPVYVVTHGLYLHLFQCWEHFTAQNHKTLSPILAGRFPASLHAGELNAFMAINALDMGDFNLAICHLKNALAAVNHTMSLLQQLSIKNQRVQSLFHADCMGVLFDLREVWLRVMHDCREEERRNNDTEGE